MYTESILLGIWLNVIARFLTHRYTLLLLTNTICTIQNNVKHCPLRGRVYVLRPSRDQILICLCEMTFCE